MSGGGIPQFFVPNIRPEVINQGGAPDFWSAVLGGLPGGEQAGLTGYREQQQNSRSSAENEIAKAQLAVAQAHLKLQQETQKTEQARLSHAQSISEAQGNAMNTFLEHLMPHLSATGQMQQLLGGQQQQQAPQSPTDQFGIPQGLPFQIQGNIPGAQSQPLQSPPRPPAAPQSQQPDTGRADPFEALAAVLPTLPPEAIPGLMQHIQPMLSLLERKGQEGQQTQTGDLVTTFVPGKGFWDPRANDGKGAFVPSITRAMNPDEKALRYLQLEEAKARLAATTAYRDDVQARVLTTQFNGRTKTLRDRGQMLQQAALTINDAANAPDPVQRKVLTSSAIANFVQAADQKANLRYQMLQYFKKNVDPSFVGGLNNAAQLLANGQYPPEVYAGLARHINRLLEQSKSEYQKQRDAEVKRHPNLEGYLPSPEEYFTNDLSGATPPPTAGPAIP